MSITRAEELIGYHRSFAVHPILAGARTTAVTRSRCAEDRLAEAVRRRGIDQYVLVGAGLDSFACRSELAREMRVSGRSAKCWALSASSRPAPG